MKAIDRKYEYHNPNQLYDESFWSFNYLENEVVSACTAIFLHNLNFNQFLWDFNQYPLATLLKVCDELQDWTRPEEELPKGYPASNYDLSIPDDGVIEFRVGKDRYSKIFSKS